MNFVKTLSAGIVTLGIICVGPAQAQQAQPRSMMEQYEKLETEALAQSISAFLEKNKDLKVNELSIKLAQYLKQRKALKIVDVANESVPVMDGEVVEPLLINGDAVDTKYFPAVFRMITDQGETDCTATVIGPSTVFFAAHCLDHNYQEIEFASDSINAKGICEQAPGYVLGRGEDDWALCLLNKSVVLPKFETLLINQVVPIGKRVVLSGYGCTTIGGNTGTTLRIGIADTVERPNWLRAEESTIYVYAPEVENGAILCPGDSGGPAYIFDTDSLNGKRWVIGSNSRTTYDARVSLISSSASPRGKDFINSWRKRYNQKICGVNLRTNCQ